MSVNAKFNLPVIFLVSWYDRIMKPLKRLTLTHAYNVRDLGGFEASGNTITKWHSIYRSDALYGLDETEWQRLCNAGIRTIVDLRSNSERLEYAETPPSLISMIHCPLQAEELDSSNLAESAAKAFEKSLSAGYCKMIEQTPQLLVTALKAVLAGLEKGGVLFHCAAGKDRTGVLAAVLLELLGVNRTDIVADYEVSFTYNRIGLFRYIRSEKEYKAIEHLLYSDRTNMDSLLECFDRVHLVPYLAFHGFGSECVERLRSLCLTACEY